MTGAARTVYHLAYMIACAFAPARYRPRTNQDRTSGGALAFQQGNWSKASKVDGNNAFATISCVGVDTCAAADQYDNAMYYAVSSQR